jgi:ArsR family metal-binding transcriptional regulator
MPKHSLLEIYELLGKKDCGVCGNPSCRTMARKIATGDSFPEQCVNISKRKIERIRRILEEGVEFGASAEVLMTEAGVTYIHPCISESGKVAADVKVTRGPEGEIRLEYGFYDPLLMCYFLQNAGIFKRVRCSPKLGVARVDWEGKTIMIFDSGRISIRRAKDREDVLRSLKFVSRVLWGSIICGCCGNVGRDCASGGCEDCVAKVCPVLAGFSEPGERRERRGKTRGSKTWVRVDRLRTGKMFLKGIKLIDRLISGLRDRLSLARAERLFNKVNQKAIKFILETERIEDAALGLILAGVAFDVKKAIDAKICLGGIKLSEKERELLERAKQVIESAYQAFKQANSKLAKETIERYLKLKQILDQRVLSPRKAIAVEIEKIATNGFYIARLLPKPLPA